MRNSSYCNILFVFLILAGSAVTAGAAVVNWASLGLDENQIQNGGQVLEDFAGISGLTCTLSGNEMFRGPYIHVSGRLHLRSVDGTPGSIPAAVINFSFNQPVEMSLILTHFGDGNIAEQALFESHGPYGFSGNIPGGSMTGGGTEALHLMSGSTYQGTPAWIDSPATTGFTLTFDGNDNNDIAGSTFFMEINSDPVGTEAMNLSSIKALFR